MRYITINKTTTNEIIIKKSKFITTVTHLTNVQEAQTFLDMIKKQHHKANHNCSAYLLASNQQHASDDGEPSGTAGIPILETLQSMEVVDTMAVVTRYFGGIKLGSGGLIRAYRQSVSEAIQKAGRVQKIYQQQLILTLTYKQFDQLQYWLNHQNITLANTTYTDNVTIELFVDKDATTILTQGLTNQLNAKIPIKLGKNTFRNIPYNKKDD
ncbi:YigZ family protein [Bombilactobacillus folatiphilus]|uniref:YigZ family protein n=1 Tax=Bombilactobacillus folatiphilus TaxID=2923362 RepID=A0ABY4P7Y8_9LACO|nr:YigZ family protein [Bombilactobacillus folatiphilus]UQS81700.1 YigZ family protein [Bombilactobacillus folatiphilus]